MIDQTTHLSPIGPLKISTKNNQLIRIEFMPLNSYQLNNPQTPFNQEVIDQLSAYFKNPKHQFTLPLHLEVTDYQQRVLKALQEIPSGETQSYSEIATLINSGARAIGNACRHNPIPVVIPCHRVTAKRHLGGYCGQVSGTMMSIKKKLLLHEAN